MPLEYQRNIGADMSMMFFVYLGSPNTFTHPDLYRIKGFDTEVIAKVFFPRPSWMTGLEYRCLTSDDSSNSGFFSLNMSFYNQEIIASEWKKRWFFMCGRVHPYTLTWEVETGEALETADSLQEYSIPAIMVRDQGYQPSV